ncbi:MAG: hybrid sensor histidine kinase/response regulator [Myxococcales bacterium]|nr:hybrid sensor histidine kinase/response regulator [Myxococcales bacterium]
MISAFDSKHLNSRVLVIDDEESVRDGIIAVLRPPRSIHTSELDAAARALFDEPLAPKDDSELLDFHVEVARSGREGIAKVEASIAADDPYAVIFCDMRMPGLDGLETIEAIRKVDQRCEVVFITAYSDHSLASITERAGANVTYFVKPFLSEEIRQLATKLVLEWNRAREVEKLIRMLATLRGSTEDMQRLIRHLLEHLCVWLRTSSAMIVELKEGAPPGFHVGVGDLDDPDGAAFHRALDAYRDAPTDGAIAAADGLVFLRLADFGVAITAANQITLDASRRYLLEVFLVNASLAIRNSRLRLELMEKERLASVGQALGNVVHDLNTPLAAIEMLVNLLEIDSDALGPPAAVYARIREMSSRARALLSDTLALCRGSVAAKDVPTGKVPLAAGLQRNAEVWRLLLAERGVGLALEIDDGLCGCVDPSALERALWNLISNASDALAEREDGVIMVRTSHSDDTLWIEVADNGPGIPDELRERLFAPFATGKRHGTGLGLAIVKQIADAHGGDIDVRTGADGTRFTLRFPCASGAALA